MKLIIDIDKQHFEILQSAVRNGMGDNSQKIIAQGIPLEQIRAEIDEIPLSEPMVSADGLYCYGSKSITMGHFREKVLGIIDRYRRENDE